MMDCQAPHPIPEQLQAYRQGSLGPAESAAIQRHVAACELCRQTLDTLAEAPSDTGQGPSGAEARTSAPAAPPHPGLEATVAYSPVEHASAPDPTAAPPAFSGVPGDLANHPRYRILGFLGAGGMGTVYKAEHRLMHRLVALKVINPDLVDRPALVERFRREVQAAALLSHPNIVTAHDAEQAGTTHFLVMEFVQGKSLAEVVAEQGPLPVARACDYARQVALGLEHAHQQGMVHRDIKPHNLMLTSDGRVKILDFGLARLALETGPSRGPGDLLRLNPPATGTAAEEPGAVTEAGWVLGTADYMAPEQARDPRHTDIRADLYGLGCTLYHLLAGHPPFPQGTLADKRTGHALQSPQPLTQVRRDVPPKLARIVERLMAKDPAQRYQTPAETAQALAPFAGVPGKRSRGRQLLRAGAVLVLLALLALWGFWTGPDIYRFATDQGRLVIEPDGQDVRVLIQQGGQPVRVLDTRTERAINLPAGTYELELAEDRDRFQLSDQSILLQRGARQTIRVEIKHGERPRGWPFRRRYRREGEGHEDHHRGSGSPPTDLNPSA